MRELSLIADDLADEINTIPGVLEVDVTGKVEREIHIRRGGLGIYQINLDNINAELRSYFQGQRARGSD